MISSHIIENGEQYKSCLVATLLKKVSRKP
jgi:hypothetical protein